MPDTIPPSEREAEPTDSNAVIADDYTTQEPVSKGGGQTGPKRVDWVSAQKFYLENPTKSYKDVAEQYGVSSTAVENRASKEGWVNARKKLGESTIAHTTENLAIANSEINARHQGMAQSMQRLVYEKMLIANRQIDKAKKEAQKNGGSIDNLTVYELGMISEGKIKSLAEAMLIAVNLERVTVNLPTAVERKEITGRNGKDLFGDGDQTKLIELISDTIVALESSSEASDSGTSA